MKRPNVVKYLLISHSGYNITNIVIFQKHCGQILACLHVVGLVEQQRYIPISDKFDWTINFCLISYKTDSLTQKYIKLMVYCLNILALTFDMSFGRSSHVRRMQCFPFSVQIHCKHLWALWSAIVTICAPHIDVQPIHCTLFFIIIIIHVHIVVVQLINYSLNYMSNIPLYILRFTFVIFLINSLKQTGRRLLYSKNISRGRPIYDRGNLSTYVQDKRIKDHKTFTLL